MTLPQHPEEPQDTMVPYALGVLDAEEAASVAERLQAGDDATVAAFHRAERLVTLMGHTAPATTLPSDLKHRLLGRMQDEQTPSPPRSPRPSAPLCRVVCVCSHVNM